MADNNPFANAGLSMFGAEGNNGLGTVAAAYLAHKAGLIDFSNKDQQDSMKKNGVLGHLAMSAINGAVAPKGPSSQFQVNPSGVSNADNADIGGGFNPAGIAPNQMSNSVSPPDSNAGVDSEINNPAEQQTSGYDPELIDHSLSSFASLFV